MESKSDYRIAEENKNSKEASMKITLTRTTYGKRAVKYTTFPEL